MSKRVKSFSFPGKFPVSKSRKGNPDCNHCQPFFSLSFMLSHSFAVLISLELIFHGKYWSNPVVLNLM